MFANSNFLFYIFQLIFYFFNFSRINTIKYSRSFVLDNGNIIIVNENGIYTYDQDFNATIYSDNFNDSGEKIIQEKETELIFFAKFEYGNQFLLISVKQYIHSFNFSGFYYKTNEIDINETYIVMLPWYCYYSYNSLFCNYSLFLQNHIKLNSRNMNA